jgi:PAS domain S-box-containing protein
MISENIEKLRQIGESLIDPDFAVRLFEEGYPDAVVVVDASGTIKLVNKHMELLFGYPRAELYDNLIEMLIPEPVRGRHVQHRHDYELDPRPRSMGAGLVLQGRHKTGREFDVEISLSPIIATQGAYTVATVRKRRMHAGTSG